MQRPQLIGLCGVAKTGKDTACRLLGANRIAFADALKMDLAPVIRARYGLDPENLTPEQKETLRPLFVAHGACARAVDPDIWIRPVVAAIHNARTLMGAGMTPHNLIAVTDVRYGPKSVGDEVGAVLKLGGFVIYLERPGYGPANDEERRSFAEIDARRRAGDFAGKMVTVVNDSDLATFAERLKAALEQ